MRPSVLIKSFFLLVLPALLYGASIILPANAADAPEQAMVSEAFEVLHRLGDATNSGDGENAALREACSMAARLGQEQANDVWSSVKLRNDDRTAFDGLVSWLGGHAQARLSMDQICVPLMGGRFDTDDTVTSLQNAGINALMGEGLALMRGTGLPYLGQLEVEGGFTGDNPQFSVLTVQPLWEDRAGGHFLFNQLSWQHETDDTDDGDADDTLNAGFAYRKLLMDDTLLMGANAFFDHQLDQNHSRLSLGLDAQTSLYGIAANRYIALSGWKGLDRLYEARALSGWDLEVSGRLPQYPDVTGYLRGFTWDSYREAAGKVDDIYGIDANVEWSPVPALVLVGGMTDANNDKPEVQAALRLRFNFNEPLDMQLSPRVGLESVADKVWSKVRRENTIRTQVRKRLLTGLTVTETAGANSAVTQEGTFTLATGLVLNMPATVTVANSVGAIARLRFTDGAILTLGQDTEVLIEPERITLNRGVAQYVSGSDNRTVNVPGATIELLGTDIDISSSGGTSNVRVRDGSVRMTGTASGSTTVTAGNMARSVGGVVAAVAQGSADYITYTDLVSTRIDRVASAVTGMKVAPYPVAAPRLITTTDTPGQSIVIGLQFNTVVTANGGPVRLTFTINGNSRTASLSGGSGTADLQFSYTLQIADIGATSLTVNSFDLNGGTLTGDGKSAVVTIVDTTLSMTAVSGNNPSLSMDFVANTYTMLGTVYNSLSSFLTAASGSFARASPATYYDASGILQIASNNVPRFDHDPVTFAARGILIEESRVNRMINSYFENWAGAYPDSWNNSGNNITKVAGTFGTNAMRISGPFPNDGNRVSFPAVGPIASGSLYSATVRVRLVSGTGALHIAIDSWGTSVFQFPASSMTTGQWVTLSATATAPGALGGSGGFHTNSTNIVVEVDWVQFEQGSSGTSYIPTTTTTATRAYDNLSLPSGAWTNDTAGTFLLQAPKARDQGVASRYYSFTGGLGQVSLINSNNVVGYVTDGAGTPVFNPGSAVLTTNSTLKHVIAYQANDFSQSVNGGAVQTDNAGTFPVLTGLSIGNNAPSGPRAINSALQKLHYYPVRIPDAQLPLMTQ